MSENSGMEAKTIHRLLEYQPATGYKLNEENPLKGDVLILDDVITAGTSVRESVEIIRAAGARPSGVLIALDRQEKGQGQGHRSAVEEVAVLFKTPVYSIIGLNDIIDYLESSGRQTELESIRRYQSAAGEIP
jgi:orotate phosphoribosyltransferase